MVGHVSHPVTGERLTITLVPAQHWSMRTPGTATQRLWGGYVMRGPEGTSYHAGDTAFAEEMFSEIGRRFPGIDWAMLPIALTTRPGSCESSTGPEEAGRAFDLLGAKNLCAMHWGTFDLTDEPPGEPPERRAWWSERGHDRSRLWIFDIGETRALG